VEALRAAQLYVYRHPGHVRGLAERDAPSFYEDVEKVEKVPPKPGGKPRRSAVKDWAGFTLSGPGR
jgi:hypothetical protein